jgi:hypothetical protein
MQIGDHIGKQHHFTSITSTLAARARQHMSSVPLRLGCLCVGRRPLGDWGFDHEQRQSAECRSSLGFA